MKLILNSEFTYHFINEEVGQGEKLGYQQSNSSRYGRKGNGETYHRDDHNRIAWDVVFDKVWHGGVSQDKADSNGVVAKAMFLFVIKFGRNKKARSDVG